MTRFDRERFEAAVARASARIVEDVPESERLTPQERCIDLARRIENHRRYSVQSATGVLPSMESVDAMFAQVFGR